MGGRGNSYRRVPKASGPPKSQPKTKAAKNSKSAQLDTSKAQTGMPSGTTTLAAVQAMTPSQFASYLNKMYNQPNPIPAVLHDSMVQNMVYDIGLNDKPAVVSTSAFNKLPGKPIYRTVNAAYDKANDVNHPATRVANQLMRSGLSRIGSGVYGDGYYFADGRPASTVYGHTRGNVQKTAVVRAKLNQNANVVSMSRLQSMLNSEPQALRQAVLRAHKGTAGYGSRNNGLSAYALYKGYNVIDAGRGYKVVLDRGALVFDSKVTAM